MLKQSKHNVLKAMVAMLILSAVALPAIVEVAGANPPQNASLGLQEALSISKTVSGVQIEVDADPYTARRVSDEGLGKGDKVWTAQFRPPLEFPGGQPLGLGEHPPIAVGGPGFGMGGPGVPPGGPPRGAPKKDCLEDINRQMGFYAYTKSKLQLKDDQKAAWKAVDDALESQMPKMRLLCETLPNEVVGLPSIIDRSDFVEQTLAFKLELVRALKGPMQQLVRQLSSVQRAVLDFPPPLPPF